jgi:hypothetical protein
VKSRCLRFVMAVDLIDNRRFSQILEDATVYKAEDERRVNRDQISEAERIAVKRIQYAG